MTIGGATRIACVIGDPVEHSRSPAMHNAASQALGLDRVYLALRVGANDLATGVRGLGALGFEGANVTVPHKEAVFALCDTRSPEAELAGAVNTLCFEGGRLHGHLTDGLGLVAALGAIPLRATVIGAGGSARAAAAALLAAGTLELQLVARNSARVAALADDLRTRFPAATIEHGATAHATAGGALIHCTPVGGISALEELPVAADAVRVMDVVADFAYRKDGSPTPLIAAASAAGIAVVDGLELLVRQGALAFALWTGIDPPLDVMRRAVGSSCP